MSKKEEQVEKSEEELYAEAFRNKLNETEAENDPKQEEEEGQVEEQEQEEPETDPEQESEGEDDPTPDDPESEKESERSKNKDKEYREFIDSQPNDELKERARKLVQGLKSGDGRASALQRKLNSKEKLIEQLYRTPVPQTVQAQPVQSARQDEPAQAKPKELPEKLKALREKNPKAAEIIEEAAKHQSDITRQELENLIEDKLGSVTQKEAETAKALEIARLEEKAEDLFGEYDMTALDVMQSEDFQYWLRIKQREEPGVYNLYASAKDADTAFLVLEKYDREWREAAAAFEKEQQESGNNNDLDSEKARADKLREKRKEKLNKSVTPASTRTAAGGKDSTDGLSYEEAWHRTLKKWERQNR